MIKSIKIRLIPTVEQEVLMIKSAGVSRFAYNWGLNRWNELYRSGEKTNIYSIKKEFNNTVKKHTEYYWLYEVSAKVTTQAFFDLDKAFKKFFKGGAKHPKFKSRKKAKQSFYVRDERIKFKDGMVHLEKIGNVKYNTNYDISNIIKYSNPRCCFDGKYWYLSFAFEHGENQVMTNEELSVGIDLGIKDLATINCLSTSINNINKTKTVKYLEKRLRRLQIKVARKYEANKVGNRYNKTNNIIKVENEIMLLYRKLANIRNNHIHQATNKIIKLYPYRVVMEDLNISGMLKNRHLSKAISKQCFHEFIRQMKYKCEFNNIDFIQVPRFYPSSKMCSCCGEIKKDLKLKERIYKCNCGFIIDRDKNASINLANYQLV